MIRCGGVVLCGGQSRRMGHDKASLPCGDETMLERVVRLLSTVVDPVVVVCGAEQSPPVIPPQALQVHDHVADQGPLAGLAAGIEAIGDRVDAVYATSCDVPLLVPAFVEHLIGQLGSRQIVVPRGERYVHPLAAVYRVSVLGDIQRLLRENRRRPIFLFETVDTLEIPVSSLRSVDPDLATLRNLNQPQDYLEALEIMGFEASDRLRRARVEPVDE